MGVRTFLLEVALLASIQAIFALGVWYTFERGPNISTVLVVTRAG